MIVFKRPDAAFHAYEQRLARQPASWPPTNHPVPTLWERARTLFGKTVETIGSTLRLAWRQSFARTERRELLIRLVPVEKIVRTLLVAEALTFLLMTPEGARLRREARTVAIPQPPTRVGKPRLMSERDRFRALAMQSVAAHHPIIDPRVVEREERERREALAAMREQNPYGDPLSRAPFRVMRWVHHTPLSVEPTPTRRIWIDLLDAPETLPRPAQPPRTAPACEDEDDDVLQTGPANAIARRIAALARVLENPQPVIRRLAARLAALPREAFPTPAPNRFRAAEWWHGRPEYYNATAHAASVHGAFTRADHKPEPG